MKDTKLVNLRRYMATFDVVNTTKGDSGRYRCIVQSDKGVGVSSYAELIVKRKYSFVTVQSFFDYVRFIC